ncbi:MAG: DNA mismatch repair endonuclease MutL [Oscillospiraceae bacterium]|nr:DNA mismatch repair endonuclease MutL [Oscillospiraceae bacterium]
MPNIIQLSSHVADLIAAGEVVERPASAAKELLENAIDAGSRHITLEIRDGGMSFLRVTDDGCGIAPDDAETAFLRHATSKIRTAEDLGNIHTLGFRGEALAAIASVSRVELLTKPRDAQTGTFLHLDGGVVTEKKEAGCPDGTTVTVRDLFYNTPARMKFMKRDTVEAAAVLAALQHQALAHPEVAFSYIRDGKKELSTAGDGDLASAIYQVLGREFASGMIPVSGAWDSYRAEGFVSKPMSSRGNRGNQHFFVNGRCVKSKMLTAALEDAYRNQILVGRFPCCVLKITVPETLVDVNVHPAKTEVKFLAEQEVFSCVRYAVAAALREKPDRPEMKLPERPQARPAAAASAREKPFFRTMNAEEYRAFAGQMEKHPVQPAHPEVTRRVLAPEIPTAPEREKPLPVMEQVQIPAPMSPAKPEPRPAASEQKKADNAPWRVAGEVLDTYIIVEQGENVLFIDKHAAHERIRFEAYKKQNVPMASQLLLAPKAAELTPEESAAALENAALLERFGFGLEDFGGGTVLLRQIPAELSPEAGEAALAALAQDLLDGKKLDPDALRDRMLHTVACKAAIKAGWHTDPMELEKLAREVMTRDDLRYCPHGRPIVVTITRTELEKQFKRQ